MGVELGWNKCIKCSEMFFHFGVAGACAAGDSHDAGNEVPSFIGIIDPITDDSNLSAISTMSGWRRCRFCQCMFFIPPPFTVFPHELKVCPALGGGGKHDATGSPNYLVTSGFAQFDFVGKFMISGWERCGKCEALFDTSNGNNGGVCISDKKPHAGIKTNLFACKQRLAILPLPSKAGPGMDVNFKFDTGTLFGWVPASSCTWTVASETRLSVQSKSGESIFVSLDFEMIDGPQCAITVNLGGTKHIEILGIDIKDITIPPTDIHETTGCENLPGGTTDPDVEWAPGVNNAAILSFPLGKMFPKNNNRVRLHLTNPISGLQDFELETQ